MSSCAQLHCVLVSGQMLPSNSALILVFTLYSDAETLHQGTSRCHSFGSNGCLPSIPHFVDASDAAGVSCTGILVGLSGCYHWHEHWHATGVSCGKADLQRSPAQVTDCLGWCSYQLSAKCSSFICSSQCMLVTLRSPILVHTGAIYQMLPSTQMLNAHV